jgi:UDP-N-acetylglucosamine--N-acetylmuramyl-(pentapeptide) pyrophosphoryl-undecaprenol N-acetylglucosamine transferase
MKIAITGGGTGGHLAIAKALKESLNSRGIEPIFIGSTYGQDRAWFEQDRGWSRKLFCETSGVVNKKGIAKLLSLWDIFRATMQVRSVLKEEGVEAVFSVGGYSAAPASFAAIISKKPFYIHEQNAVMGRLNKMLLPKATMLFSSYHDSVIRDYPVREIFFQKARVRHKIERIIFLGGSQGASAINTFAMQVAEVLDQRGIKIIHQCGERDFDMLYTFYKQKKIEADLFAFSKEIEEKIAVADFAICRAGAGTVWELTATQLPALFIPYPYAAGDHQYHNAKFLVDQAVALLVRQEALTPEILEAVWKMDIADVSKKLSTMIAPKGAEKIIDTIVS